MKSSIEIIYEDNDFAALLKPAGIVVHSDRYHKTETLVNELVKKFPSIKKVGDDPNRPGIVHRLDKDTSGILIVAKNQESFQYFKKIFQERNIKKQYVALVVGNVKQDSGIVDLPIGRGYKEPTKRVSRGRMRGFVREAITEFRVKDRFGSYTLLELTPLTGRTHQIRSHLAAIGHPVVCDGIYAGKRFVCPFGLKRQFLHAFSLDFTAPSGSRLRLEAELPDDLKKTLAGLQRAVKYDKKEKPFENY